MKNKIVVAIGSVALLTMVSSAVFGYALLSPARRWFPTTPITVRVDNGGLSSVIDSTSGSGAAAAAVDAWDHDSVNVVNGQSANVSYRQGDGQSDILFSDPLHLCTGSCIAATLTGYYNTGATGACGSLSVVQVTDADIAFNLSYDYTTVAETAAQGGCLNEIYLEAVVTHEVGHVIGLAHSSGSALMAPTVSYCVNKPLASDDLAGEDALYNCTFTTGGGGGCKPAGQICTANSNCCSQNCKGKAGAKTCR